LDSAQEDRYVRVCSYLRRFLNGVLAEGNPDEEKIGAFGVGRFEACSKPSTFLLGLPTGFYSLFSVTEKPWVFSGGTSISVSLSRNKQVVHTRSMDELLLEG
jgi:hypothetical protein